MIRFRTLSALFAALIIACSCSPEKPGIHKSTRLVMGTFVDVSIVGAAEPAKEGAAAAFDEMKRIEDLTSFHKPSQLTAINDHSGQGPVKTDAEVLSIVAEALKASEQTGGAFDPTIGAVSRLWKFSGEGESRIPTEDEIKTALSKVGYSKVILDQANSTIELTEPGMALDLGGITKGHALNRCAIILKKLGISSALVNIGGDILALGGKEPGKPWRIGVEDPRDKNAMVAVTELTDQVIFTSGDYERFIEMDGKRYHHILDPKTGYPAEGVRSVTVVGKPGETLQPFGTSAFVMGARKGLEFLESKLRLPALLVDGEGKILMTTGSEKVFKLKP
jgi:FAD:protein FMN transferase